MDTAQWPQGIGLEKTMEENNEAARLASEKRARPQEQLNCPRCNSTNTKFCYYNNYSLTQPRYFCKTCRRYWTEGGTLRNVPVGGGSRKNKKSSSSSAAAAASSSSSAISKTNMVIPDLNPPSMSLMMTSHFSSHQNPRMMIHEAAGQDLNLAFSAANNVEQHYNGNNNNNGSTTSALELLRTSYIPNSMQDSNNNNNNAVLYSSSSPGFSLLQEFKPSQLGFCVDGLGGSSSARYGDHPQENGSRLLFPFGDLKQTTTSAGRHHHELDHQNNKGQGNPSGYWNGLMGGGAAGSW